MIIGTIIVNNTICRRQNELFWLLTVPSTAIFWTKTANSAICWENVELRLQCPLLGKSWTYNEGKLARHLLCIPWLSFIYWRGFTLGPDESVPRYKYWCWHFTRHTALPFIHYFILIVLLFSAMVLPVYLSLSLSLYQWCGQGVE